MSVEAVFLEGDVLSALVEYAERSGPDLIIMTTHGRSGLSRFWLGSITDGIVRKRSIPVLVTRGEAAAGPRTADARNNHVKHGYGDSTVHAPMFPRVLVPLDGTLR